MMTTRRSCVAARLLQVPTHQTQRSASSSERPSPASHLRLEVPLCLNNPVLNLIVLTFVFPFVAGMAKHLIISNRLLRYSPSSLPFLAYTRYLSHTPLLAIFLVLRCDPSRDRRRSRLVLVRSVWKLNVILWSKHLSGLRKGGNRFPGNA